MNRLSCIFCMFFVSQQSLGKYMKKMLPSYHNLLYTTVTICHFMKISSIKLFYILLFLLFFANISLRNILYQHIEPLKLSGLFHALLGDNLWLVNGRATAASKLGYKTGPLPVLPRQSDSRHTLDEPNQLPSNATKPECKP